VISHPLGLPLAVALHGQEPDDLPFLSRERRKLTNDNDLDQLLQDSVEYCQSNNTWKETVLTGRLSEMIMDQAKKTGLYADKEVNLKTVDDQRGRLDILLSSEKKERLAVIEVGLDNSIWFEKFNQSYKYINLMIRPSKEDEAQKKPLLLATLTIQFNKTTTSYQSKLGVFLCVPITRKSKPYYRMILLGNTFSMTLDEASKAFGRFLRTTSWFSDWIRAEPQTTDGYEYLSSNCCLVENEEKIKYVSMTGVSESLCNYLSFAFFIGQLIRQTYLVFVVAANRYCDATTIASAIPTDPPSFILIQEAKELKVGR
jgi:hypothetical protein